MAKEKNVISLEIERFEKKIKEYQTYLQLMDITKMTEEDSRHKEITTQNSIMNLLPQWLDALKKLREESSKKEIEVRGGGDIPEIWKHMKGGN